MPDGPASWLVVPALRRRRDDRAEAALLGEALGLGLGEVRLAARGRRRNGLLIGLAGVEMYIVAYLGIALVIATSGVARVVNAVVFGVLALAGGVVAGAGLARAPVVRRLFWYAGGLAQFVAGEPEPHVVRWDDVKTITVTHSSMKPGSEPEITGFALRGPGGTVLASIGKYRKQVMCGLVAEAGRVLAPRLVPPLIGAYESGEPVMMGWWRIDRRGITDGRVTGGRHVSWAGMKSVDITYMTYMAASVTVAGAGAADFTASDVPPPVKRITIRPRSGKAFAWSPSAVPNGIFLPHLIAHAAKRDGVTVRRLPRKARDRTAVAARDS